MTQQAEVKQDVFWPPFDCDGVYIIATTEVVLGSDYDFDPETGVEIKKTPEFQTYYTLKDGSFPCDTLEEIQGHIIGMCEWAEKHNCLPEMIETLCEA